MESNDITNLDKILMMVIFLSILFIISVLLFYYCQNKNKQYEKFTITKQINKPIFLAIRSYNRPEYLEKTLTSIKKSDTSLCNNIIIYDDCSTDKETLRMLKESEELYTVIYNKKNKGCKQSYLNLLKYIKKNVKYGYVCIVDNDILVKKQWLNKLYDTYKEAEKELTSTNIVMSGFNPTNAHQYSDDEITKYKNFHLKYSVGAVCYFFNLQFIKSIYKGWKNNLDWGISEYVKQKGYYFAVLNEGVVDHIGEEGDNSTKDRYDNDKNFVEDFRKYIKKTTK